MTDDMYLTCQQTVSKSEVHGVVELVKVQHVKTPEGNHSISITFTYCIIPDATLKAPLYQAKAVQKLAVIRLLTQLTLFGSNPAICLL